MKRNLMPLIAVAFIAAVAATGIFYGLLLPKLASHGGAGVSGRVVAAAKSLPRGALLRSEDLVLVAAPLNTRAADWHLEPEAIVGRTLLEPVTRRQPIARRQVSSRGQAGGASLALPAGMRAVAIHPAQSGSIVNLLESGNRVDVLVLDGRSNPGQIVLRRLMEGLEVLSVGRSGDTPNPEITVVASVRDAEKLLLADSSMQLRLALRNPGDRGQEGAEPLHLSQLFEKGQPSARASGQPPARDSVRASLQ